MKKSTIHAMSLFATMIVTGTVGVANFSGELGNAFAMSHLGNTSGAASNMTSMGSNMTSGNMTGNMTGGNNTAPHAANITTEEASAPNASLSS
jgi:hypothetical protein